MKVFSPSFKRSNGVKTHKILSDVIYVVGESEKQEYEDHGYNVQSIPDKINGNIARVRNYIKDNFIKDKGVMIDDDIEDVRRWNYKDDKFVAESINLQEFIEKSFVLCEEWDCRLFGVNIVGDKGSYREYSPFSLNSWISGSFMGFLNNECSFDERIPLKEDLDMSVQVLNKYRRLLRFNYVHLIKKDHKNIGGCADYRTIEREKEQLKIFQKKWGSKIVKTDDFQRGKKIKVYDINPIVKVPIKGI